MNCRRVQKLIPLHVGGDLRANVANQVESHLDWCGRCNWLADEYKESQRWLHASQPPQFDETFLNDFKRSVMKRVTENNARPSLLASLARQWSRRQILALAASFIVLGMVSLYFYQERVTDNPQVISGVVDEPPGEEAKATGLSQPESAGGEAPGASSNRRHRGSNSKGKSRSMAGHPVVASQAAATLVSQTSGTTEPAKAITDPNRALTGTANRSRDMLRIEIQTGDPSIRIIWFAPKETASHQNKPATD